MSNNRQHGVLAILMILFFAAGGAALLDALLGEIEAQPIQHRRMFFTEVPVGIPGEDCIPDEWPDAYLASTGGTLVCDATEEKWTIQDTETTHLKIRLHGVCEAFGDNASEYCMTDTDCANHASCSGGVCNCLITSGTELATVYKRGTSEDYFDQQASIMRYDILTDSNLPYPGIAVEGSATLALYGGTCTEPGCNLMEVNGSGVTFNPDSDVATYAFVAKSARMSIEGQGSGASKYAGFFDGYTRNNTYSAGGDAMQITDGFASTTYIGKLTNSGSNFCVEWWDGGAPAAQDMTLCRTAANTLTFAGGTLVGAGGVERVSIPFGAVNLTTAEMNAGYIMEWPVWSYTKGPGGGEMGWPMVADGSVTGASGSCLCTANPTSNGTIRVTVYKAGGTVASPTPTALWACYSGTCDTTCDETPCSWGCEQAAGTDSFSQGDMLYLEIREGTFDPSANGTDCIGTLEVTYD